MRRYLFVLVGLLFWASISAQRNDMPIFQRSPEEGLTQGRIDAIGQDSEGYIWLYGAGRIVRYDGNSYKYYDYWYNKDTKNERRLFPKIFSFEKDSKGQIIARTLKKKLFYYNRKKDGFFEFNYKYFDSSLTYKINGLVNNGRDKMFAIADGNFCILDSTGVLFPVLSNKKLFSNNFEILPLHNQHAVIIFSFFRNKAYRIDLSDNTIVPVHFDKSVSYDMIKVDSNDFLWCINTNTGIVSRFDSKGNFLKEYRLENSGSGLPAVANIRDALVDSGDKLWLTTNAGLFVINPKLNYINNYVTNYLKPNSLICNDVTAIFEDNDDGIWIGTSNGGLDYTHPKITDFSYYKIPGRKFSPQIIVNGFAADNRDNIYIATTYGGIWILNNQTHEFTKLTGIKRDANIEKFDIRSIFIHRNKLWFGTLYKGVYNIDLQTYVIEKAPLKDKGNYHAITQFDYNHLLFATGKTVIKLNIKSGKKETVNFFDEKGNKQSVSPLDIFKSSEGLILAGALFRYLYVYDKDNNGFYPINNYAKPFEKIGKRLVVEKIIEDDDKNIWAVTRLGGILKLNFKNKEYNWLQKSGRFNLGIIKSVVTDQFGNLWISSINGVHHLNIEKDKLIQFSKDEGLQSNLFQTRSSYRASDNRIFLGGVNGFNVFYPRNIATSEAAKSVQLTGLKVNNVEIYPDESNKILHTSLNKQEKIVLNYNQRNFTFEFHSFDYLNLGKQNYRYKLIGFDNEWQYVNAKETQAVYKEIPIGEYTFTVAASVDDDWSNDVFKQIYIVVLPPWWRTKSAILIYVILISLLLFITYKIVKERIKLYNNLLVERTIRKNNEEATKNKLRFFTNISHEFRTPLTLIAGSVEKLMKIEGNITAEKTLVNVVYLNTRRMLRLINQLLDFTKMESKDLQISVAKVDIAEFIERNLGTFVYRAQRKSIDFKYAVSPKLNEVWFDEAKIETVLYNLLSNSFKYTPDGGKITLNIKASEREGYIDLLLKDTGKGIAPDQLKKIFDRFYQVQDNVWYGGGGTGIGLSIVKEYIKIHKGTVEAKSHLGEGTEFLITIPVSKELYNKDQIIIEGYKDLQKIPSLNIKTTGEAEEHPKEIDHDAPTILIVEDNIEMRDFIIQCLSGSFKLLEAEDGNSGLKMAYEYFPNLIVSDVKMPGMDGIELCKKIKTDIILSHIPVILLTAKSTVEDHIDGIESGADIYLTKPFNPDILEARIKQLIEQRGKLAEYFKNDLHSVVDSVSTNPYDHKFLNEIIDIIKSEISNDNLNVQLLSDKIGFNHQQLYRKIKAITGQSVNEFIRTIRLKHSAKLLKSTNTTISEIMYDCGFSNRSYFSKCFKAHFGITPKEYKEK